MRFIVDECTGPSVARWFSKKGNNALSVYDKVRGADDAAILQIANKEDRIIITNDKDFGELVYKHGLTHKGVILLRLDDETMKNKIACLKILLNNYSEKLKDNFIVVTEKSIRIIEH